MSSFILCYRPRRPVLTVVSCFCLMSSICFLSVFMLSHCCLVSSTLSFLVLCLQFIVVLIMWSWCPSFLVLSPTCLRLCPLVSPLCLVPVLCCPLLSSVVLLLSHHHHHCPVMSPLSSRLFHVLCRGLCPLVSSLLLCFVSSSPVSLLSLSCLSSVRPPAVLWLCERDTSVRRILVHNKTHISIREQTNILVCRWSDGTRRGTISHPAGDKHNYSAAITECRDTERKTLLTSAARIHLDVWCLVELVSQCERQS